MIVTVDAGEGGIHTYNDATAEIAGSAFVIAQKNETIIYADGNWNTAHIKKEEESGVIA